MLALIGTGIGLMIGPVQDVLSHGNNGKHGNNGHTNQTSLVADQFGASIYMLGRVEGTLTEGILFGVPSWDALLPGDDIIEGTFWAPLGLIIETDICLFDTLENTVIEFINIVMEADEIEVTCEDGYYACCTCQENCALALCRLNTDPDPVYPCEGGGRGSTHCKIKCKATQNDID